MTPTFSEKRLLPIRNNLKGSASNFHSFGHSGYSDGHSGYSNGQSGYSNGHSGYSNGHSGYSNGHSGYSNGHSGYSNGYDTVVHKSECCEPVIDNYSFLALMIFISLATYFLQVAITMNLGRRKKRSAKSRIQNNLLDIIINSGMKLLLSSQFT